MPIGINIKSARKAKGLTQAELAEQLGLATGTIQQYELGKREPKVETVKKIAAALGVDPTSLYDRSINFSLPDYPIRLPEKEALERLSAVEQEYTYLRLLADTAPDQLKERFNSGYDKLNKLGQVEAVRRTEELTKLQQYTEPDPKNHHPAPTEPPSSGSNTGEGTDTSQ